MPTTPCVGLPYPSNTDPIDIPGDIQALAVAVDTAICDVVGPFLGQIMPCFRGAGWTVPAGTLVCDGSSFASNTYPELYALLGNTASTPDLRGNFLRGSDVSFPNSGDTGGTNPTNVAEHNHVSPLHGHTSGAHDHDIAGHNHVQSPHNHTQTPHSHTQNQHSHSISGHSHTTDIDHGHTASSGNTTPFTNQSLGFSGGVGAFSTALNQSATSSQSNTTLHNHAITVASLNVANETTASQSGGTSTNVATATNQQTTPQIQDETAVNTAQPLTQTGQANETLGDTAVTVEDEGTTDAHGNLPPFYGVTYVIQAVPRPT